MTNNNFAPGEPQNALSVQTTRIHAVPFVPLEDERISAVFLPSSPFTSAAVGVIAPGVAQAHHRHARPDNGIEIIFVYQGTFELVTDGPPERFDADADGPVYIQVPSGVPASIKNVGRTDVWFFSVFAPPFALGEIHYVE